MATGVGEVEFQWLAAGMADWLLDCLSAFTQIAMKTENISYNDKNNTHTTKKRRTKKKSPNNILSLSFVSFGYTVLLSSLLSLFTPLSKHTHTQNKHIASAGFLASTQQ